MNRVEVPDEFPESFRRAGYLPRRLRDNPSPVEATAQEQAWRFVREQVHRLQHLVFPHHGL
jgi:hypothetical protein